MFLTIDSLIFFHMLFSHVIMKHLYMHTCIYIYIYIYIYTNAYITCFRAAGLGLCKGPAVHPRLGLRVRGCDTVLRPHVRLFLSVFNSPEEDEGLGL